MRLIVYFDGQFWNGLIEIETRSGLTAVNYVFGGEPKDGKILHFVNTGILPHINNNKEENSCRDTHIKRVNPKRLKRMASKEMKSNPVSTASQIAMQERLEEMKAEKKVELKKEKEEKKKYKKAVASEKAKEKRRGR